MLGDYQSPPNTNKHPDGQEDAKPPDYKLHGTAEKTAIYIGTNVEYGEKVETRSYISHKTGKAHFLRDAATQHGDEYKNLMKKALET